MEKTIVIIDDDPVTLKILEKFLIEMRCKVFAADTGTDGYALVKREKPDILISDMLLPGIHGVELCQKIKGDPELNHIKIILMTSVYKNGIHRLTEMECNKDGFLKKPIEFNQLTNLIKNI